MIIHLFLNVITSWENRLFTTRFHIYEYYFSAFMKIRIWLRSPEANLSRCFKTKQAQMATIVCCVSLASLSPIAIWDTSNRKHKIMESYITGEINTHYYYYSVCFFCFSFTFTTVSSNTCFYSSFLLPLYVILIIINDSKWNRKNHIKRQL